MTLEYDIKIPYNCPYDDLGSFEYEPSEEKLRQVELDILASEYNGDKDFKNKIANILTDLDLWEDFETAFQEEYKSEIYDALEEDAYKSYVPD